MFSKKVSELAENDCTNTEPKKCTVYEIKETKKSTSQNFVLYSTLLFLSLSQWPRVVVSSALINAHWWMTPSRWCSSRLICCTPAQSVCMARTVSVIPWEKKCRENCITGHYTVLFRIKFRLQKEHILRRL